MGSVSAAGVHAACVEAGGGCGGEGDAVAVGDRAQPVVGLVGDGPDARGVAVAFVAWTLGIWAVVDPILSGPGVGQGLIILVASGLLLAGARRAKHRDDHPRRSTELDALT
jgi:hypothetical protein